MFRDTRLEQWLTAYRQADEIVRQHRGCISKENDLYCTFVAVAIGAGAIATGVSGAMAAGAQEDANKANLAAAQSQQQLAYQQWLQSVGQTGHAALPWYGGNFEQQLFNDLEAQFQASQGGLTPAQQFQQYQQAVSRFIPSQELANQVVQDLFTGKLTQEELGFAQPVFQARSDLAATQKGAILDSLQQQLNAISAARARAGYVGGGTTFEKNRLTQATIPALQAAAGAAGAAKLANAQEEQQIKTAGLAEQISGLNLPGQAAAANLNLINLPVTAATSRAVQATQPFQFFRINQTQAPVLSMPTQQPVLPPGAFAAGAAGSLGSSIGNYLVTQQLINSLKTPSVTGGGGVTTFGPTWPNTAYGGPLGYIPGSGGPDPYAGLSANVGFVPTYGG